MAMFQIADLEEKIREIGEQAWSPVDVVEINDQVVRMAYAKGEYHWHTHQDDDEMFYLIKGDLTIQLRNHTDIEMATGQFVVVPKGEEHAPKSKDGAYILLFEPKKLDTRGD